MRTPKLGAALLSLTLAATACGGGSGGAGRSNSETLACVKSVEAFTNLSGDLEMAAALERMDKYEQKTVEVLTDWNKKNGARLSAAYDKALKLGAEWEATHNLAEEEDVFSGRKIDLINKAAELSKQFDKASAEVKAIEAERDKAIENACRGHK